MSNENGDDNSIEFWRTKCMKLEKVIKTLSGHCVRVVEHHEDLLVKFKKNQNEYEKLKAKYLVQGKQIVQARDVLTPVSNELKMLREKYEVAVRCQLEAEAFAIKTSNKNKELNRRSQMMMAKLGPANIVDINIDDDPEEGDEEEKKYIDKLGQQIEDLEEEKSTLRIQIKELAENLEDEKESNKRLKEKIDKMKEELQQANTTIKEQTEVLEKVAVTSEMAFKEFVDMEQSYKKEHLVRSEAERFAKRLCTERDQARRESSIALSQVAGNKKLMDALMEIQELNAQSVQMKEDFDKQITDLQEQLKAAKELYDAETLNMENEELNADKNTLQEKLEKKEKEIADLRTKYAELQETYKVMETKYEKMTAIPIPPPPPPPPPPPKVGFLQKLVGRKAQRERAKEKLQKGGVSLNDNHSKAVEEMMERIKKGNVGLRPVHERRKSQEDSNTGEILQSLPERGEPSAMNELQGLLSKMKKARSEDDLSVFGDTGVSEDSELGKILKKRYHCSEDKTELPPPKVSEPVTVTRPVPSPRKLSTIPDETEED